MSIITIDGADHRIDADIRDEPGGPFRWKWLWPAPPCGRCQVPLTTDGTAEAKDADVVTSSGVDAHRYAKCVACGVLWPVDGAPLPPPVDLTRGRYLMELRVGLVIDLDAGGKEAALDAAERHVRACLAGVTSPEVKAADLIDTGVTEVATTGDPDDLLTTLM